MFALPGLVGLGIDRLFGTKPLGSIVGAALGFCIGILQLISLASRTSDHTGPRGRRTPGGSGD